MSKFSFYTISAIVSVSFGLGSCAPGSAVPTVADAAVQSEAVRQLALRFESLLEETRRVQNVGYRILTANVGQCKKTGPVVGVSVLSERDLPKEIRPIAAERLGLAKTPTVVHLVPGAPGEKAGLKVGDRLLSIAGKTVSASRNGNAEFAEIMRRTQTSGAVRFTVSSGGVKRTVPVQPVSGCYYPVLLAGKNQPNAYTDGRKIVVQRGMLNITSKDEELALIIGHELAHITSGHLQKKATNQVAGTFGGLALDLAAAAAGVNTGGAFTRAGGDIGRRAYSQSFEKEADYVGMYYVARAGYDISRVEQVWRKMGDADPKSITFAGTHPTSAERFLVLAKTRKEILSKKKSRQALLPNKVAQR